MQLCSLDRFGHVQVLCIYCGLLIFKRERNVRTWLPEDGFRESIDKCHWNLYAVFQKDGSPIQINRAKVSSGNLTIEGLRRQDFGFYQCTATNNVAIISSSTQLIIEGTQPHAPYNVTGTATEFSVILSWFPGYSGGPDYKQDYTIW